MNLFKRSKPEPTPVRTSPAVLDLQERMERLEKRLRDIETDWASQYDKFHRLNMRLARRQKAIEAHEEAEEPNESRTENAPRGTNGERRIQNPLAELLLRRGRI